MAQNYLSEPLLMKRVIDIQYLDSSLVYQKPISLDL